MTLNHRIHIFEKLKAEYDEWVKRTPPLSVLYSQPHSPNSEQARQEISVTMPDGAVRKGMSWETSPMQIASEISKSLAERIVIAKVRQAFVCVFDEISQVVRSTVNYGIWRGRLRNHASLSYLTSSLPKVYFRETLPALLLMLLHRKTRLLALICSCPGRGS